MFGIGFQEILIIALVVLLFFGGKKIPELMKGLGKGVRSFKDGMNGKEEKEKERKLSKGFGIGIIVTYVAALIVGIVMGATVMSDFDSLLDML